MKDWELSALETLLDSFRMRRETIQSNCEAMEDRLEEDVKRYEVTSQRYDKDCSNFKEMLQELSEMNSSPKLFFEFTSSIKNFTDSKRSLAVLIEAETTLISTVNSVNSKVSPH